MNPNFKVAQISDLEILLPLVRDFYEYDRHHFDEGVVRTALGEFLSEASLGQAWLILAEEAVVGYMVLTLGYSLNCGGRDAFVDEIFIQESHRGQGIGRRAFAFLEAWGRAHGLKALHLEVERANNRARAVYQALGFVEQKQHLMTCWLQAEPLDFNFNKAGLLELDSLLSLMPGQDSDLNKARQRASLSELLGNESLGQVWLIGAETGWCGYLVLTWSYSLEFHGRDALLDELYLNQTCRRPDLERKALQFASQAARLRGAHALHVRVKHSQIQEQEIYREAAFEDDDSYLMTKMIEP